MEAKAQEPVRSKQKRKNSKPRGKPIQPGQVLNPAGRPKGSLNKATAAHKEFCRGIIESPEYRAALAARMVNGSAGPMEAISTYYAEGKPKDTVEVTVSQREREAQLKALPPEEYQAVVQKTLDAVAILARLGIGTGDDDD